MPIWAIVVLLLGIVAVAVGLKIVPVPFTEDQSPVAEETVAPEPSPTLEPLPFRSAEVTAAGVGTEGFLSWALLDQRTGEIVGSANMTKPTTTMSMIKAWIAADYLRRATENGQAPSESKLRDLEAMIRDSDNASADRTWADNGRAESIERLISICGLTDTKPPARGYGFGYTTITAQDAVRMGHCIADGRAAGPTWTPILLEWMRGVRGLGDFGIAKALPGEPVAVKNGWDIWHEDDTYRTNCLAIGETWVMAVLLQYPSSGNDANDLAHNGQVCQNVATLLLNPDAS